MAELNVRLGNKVVLRGAQVSWDNLHRVTESLEVYQRVRRAGGSPKQALRASSSHVKRPRSY